jgi:hypothetical protein
MILSTTLGSESYFPVSNLCRFESGFGTYSRSITKLVFLTRQNLSQNSTHDLPASSLRQVGNDEDSLWCCKRTNALSDLQNEVLLQLVIDLVSILDCHECVDGLSSQFIVNTDDCGFCNCMMLDQGCFDFGSRETVTGDIDNVVDSASNPVVSFVITSSSIASEL